jgi:hypothetical protein
MASNVEIVNTALAYISQSSIASLDERSREAALAKTHLSNCRKELLRMRRWNFSTSSATLAGLDDVEDAQGLWAYGDALPSDCLRALSVHPSAPRTEEFEIRGRTLLCDVADAKLIYTADITDPTRFDSLFTAALAARLAAALAVSMTVDGKIQANAQGLAQRAFAEAAAADAGERGRAHPSSLLSSRR